MKGVRCDPPSSSSLPCSSSSQPLSPFLLCCVMLDYWKGKSPKSALLPAFAVLSLFALYVMFFMLTKWKMLQTLFILIKHISASVTADSVQTVSFKTTAAIKVFSAALLIHAQWRFLKHLHFFSPSQFNSGSV